jgi:putative RNA 2'-phosphotransferase
MAPSPRVRLSKFLSRVLRHRPELAGIVLDHRGRARLDDLAAAASRHLGFAVTRDDLLALTEAPAEGADQKRRFEVEGEFMRAGHGHSIPVEGYRPVAPAGPLYHATPRTALAAVLREGLRAMRRQKVHLASDVGITVEAARRRSGDVVVLAVTVARAAAAGVGFYASADPRIVLSDDVPPEFLEVKA